MAKYTIIMGCGHESTVELFGKEIERQRKIEYFQGKGLCNECYRNKITREKETEGLSFNASVLPYIDTEDGNILLSVWFSGNTMPYKDNIKSLGGYRWGEREAADDWYSFSDPPMCWNKVVKFENLQEEIKKAVSIGAENMVTDSGLFAMTHYHIAIERQKEWKETRDRISSIGRPPVPSILSGHRWNQKIYGKSGSYSVYLDGKKIDLTDQQVEEVKRYLINKEEYNKKVEEIRNEKKS